MWTIERKIKIGCVIGKECWRNESIDYDALVLANNKLRKTVWQSYTNSPWEANVVRSHSKSPPDSLDGSIGSGRFSI